MKSLEQKPSINSLIFNSRFDFAMETPSSLKRKTLKLSLWSFVLGIFIGVIISGVSGVGLYMILKSEPGGNLALWSSKLSQNFQHIRISDL
jgi:hypothetical protein